jgi:hypothetical protein
MTRPATPIRTDHLPAWASSTLSLLLIATFGEYPLDEWLQRAMVVSHRVHCR